ncbi:carboxylesterase/lipase family protein [Hymenobacter psychrophilus]|uniref:Carboxylic ester hydrolase n=1 Tax=Hymenobacter psychrophilus TaxID=651662 RepID=A0A1H3L2D9_9BACT|nr:carboxylesterase/lipase family protein [Hymenobacter psychrophilus]SDY58583.1 para-nitrobenzyl esterase [Hymenobacter psychrophilus]
MKGLATALLLLSLLLGRSPAAPAQANNDGLVATTEAGQVRGQRVGSVLVFKSIPYAAPPVGELRFAAPAPHQPWPGVRDATQPGPTAPYNRPPAGVMDDQPLFGAGWVKGDDYLTTNIWTPALNGPARPVLVFIHGGAFVVGSGDVPVYDGTTFAQKGVVLVSLNYRLGIEGFLKIKGVPSNLGIRDQLAALRWVQANIARFGGDPANVTICGESAGAMSVATLLGSPAAEGLFRRAILMSGSGQAVLSGEQADRIAAKYAQVLKIKNTAEAYRRFTPEQLLAAQRKVTPKMVKLATQDYPDPGSGTVLYFPVIDGDIVPAVPLTSVQQGAGSAVDVLVGYNSDEANYFLIPTGLLKKVKSNFVLTLAAKRLHPAPAALITVYKQAYPAKSPGQLLSAMATAYQFQVPSVRLADAHARQPGRTYMYEFAWPSSVAGGTYGAYHGLGLPFVFNQRALVTGPRGMLGPEGGPAELAEKMQDAWVAFAKTGSPGWAPYTPAERQTMLLNTNSQLQTNPHTKELRAWEGVR